MAPGSEPQLPQGGHIAGLFYGTTEVPADDDTTDSEIDEADAIVVYYRSPKTGVDTYRTVHGAPSKQGLGNVIRYTTRVVSPVKRGRTSGDRGKLGGAGSM